MWHYVTALLTSLRVWNTEWAITWDRIRISVSCAGTFNMPSSVRLYLFCSLAGRWFTCASLTPPSIGYFFHFVIIQIYTTKATKLIVIYWMGGSFLGFKNCYRKIDFFFFYPFLLPTLFIYWWILMITMLFLLLQYIYKKYSFLCSTDWNKSLVAGWMTRTTNGLPKAPPNWPVLDTLVIPATEIIFIPSLSHTWAFHLRPFNRAYFCFLRRNSAPYNWPH